MLLRMPHLCAIRKANADLPLCIRGGLGLRYVLLALNIQQVDTYPPMKDFKIVLGGYMV